MKTPIRITILFSVSFWVITINAQIISEKPDTILKLLANNKIDSLELVSQFNNFDYSTLFLDSNTSFLGFRGEKYQRIDIKFMLVIKNRKELNKYFVFGKRREGQNIFRFIGEIEISNIRELINSKKQIYLNEAIKQKDDDQIKRFSIKKYALFATYSFFEDPNKLGSGQLEGNLEVDFFLDGDKIIKHFDIESDGYKNNIHIGTWIGYLERISLICNWGEFRIPNSGDLDIGVGEFTPNPKYFKNGWESYYNAYIINDKKAREEEEVTWW